MMELGYYNQLSWDTVLIPPCFLSAKSTFLGDFVFMTYSRRFLVGWLYLTPDRFFSTGTQFLKIWYQALLSGFAVYVIVNFIRYIFRDFVYLIYIEKVHFPRFLFVCLLEYLTIHSFLSVSYGASPPYCLLLRASFWPDDIFLRVS